MNPSSLVEVRYVRVPEPSPPDAVAGWLALLSEEERQRAGRFGRERDRSTYVAAHALLRRTLAGRADVPPERWTFRAGARGKPEVAGPEASLGLEISLSHTRGLAVCAVSGSGRVGVDVEHARRLPPLRISETCFAPEERENLVALPESERPGRFFEFWTLKEALLKALGLGLTYPLDRLSFSVDGGAPRIHIPEDLGEASRDWRFDSWLVDDEFRIALAAKTAGSLCRVTLERATL